MMKNLILISGILIISCFTLLAQENNNIENVDYLIANVKENIVYFGVDNPIKVVVSNYDMSEINVEVEGAKIKTTDTPSLYVVYDIDPNAGKIVTINLFHKNRKIGNSSFRVLYAPQPVISVFGLKQNSQVHMGQLFNANILASVPQDFPYDFMYKVESFTFEIENDNGEINSFKVEGNSLRDNEEALESLKEKGKSGNKVYFKDFVVVGGGVIYNNFPSICVTLL
ncbi:MAG TPA: GldM family protein [Bacteroidales bacterium]|nr:GldM family protein [Bacteroidales bacterium]